MTSIDLRSAPVLVVGAGIMGGGIAQVAALAGHRVLWFDTRAGAAAQALDKLAGTLKSLADKGKLKPEAARDAVARIAPITALAEAREAVLVVEAIVENLDAKRALFRELEGIVAPEAVLATNTSSISVTAIANGLSRPQRLVGMHFFNPVPLMKLVEVVHGLQTEAAVAEAVFELSKHWGKVPVHAKSTPGFIVNRIARPYYAETLALLQEQAARPHEIDACLAGAGFRMGPCELMDLIGHDTNFAVTNSVYAANFYDKRYVPSLVQRELVDGGLLGRKSGRGFYRYEGAEAGVPALAAPRHEAPPAPRAIAVHGDDAIARRLAEAATRVVGREVERRADADWTGLAIDGQRLMLTDGRTAAEAGAAAVFDRFDPARVDAAKPLPLAFAVADEADAEIAAAWLAALGFLPVALRDVPGLVVARTLAMLVNEAADAVVQGVCDAAGADAAMKLGVNYPCGPFDWLRGWAGDERRGAAAIVALLDALDTHYRGERYRASPWLRRRALAARPEPRTEETPR